MRESDILEIANHTQSVIRDMDTCADMASLGKTYDAWEIWAKAKHVAPGVMNHMTAKFHDLRRGMSGGHGAQRYDRKSAAAGGDQ